MNRSFKAIATKCLLASLLVVMASQLIGPLAFALDDTSLLGSEPQSLQDLFESEFAVLRIQGDQAKVAGVGFVIQQSPIRILTCYHVVSEGTEPNEGSVTYAIARRTEATNEIDVRKAIVSWLKIKRILFKPEYDMAVLEIDPQINEGIAEKLHLKESKPLTLSFDSAQRSIGSPVTWLTTAAQGDLTLTPRLFTGSVVANYVADERYSYQSNSGNIAQQMIPGARMLEVDKLPFLPPSPVNVPSIEVVYPWIVPWKRQQQDLDSFPNLRRWFNAVRKRPRETLAVAATGGQRLRQQDPKIVLQHHPLKAEVISDH